MSDAKWTPATTQQAIALWVGGKDVADIASEFGVAPGEVLSRIAQAAIAGDDTPTARSPIPAVAASPKIAASKTKTAALKTAASKASGPKASMVKASTIKPAETKTAPEPTMAAETAATTRSAMKPSAVETAPSATAEKTAGAPRTPPVSNLSQQAAAVPPVPRPSPLRLVPTPPALARDEAPDAASTGAPVAARGYEAVVLPAPVRTSKRLLVAADGGAGVPFMKATTLDCHFPLWADTETVSIERKRVCGCRALAGKSWCAHHLSAVFEPPRKPQPRVA